VYGEDDWSARRSDRIADRFDVVRHGDFGSVGIGRLEPGERYRGDLVAVGTQRGGDFVPRPRAEPEPGDQDDRCGHAGILATSWPRCFDRASFLSEVAVGRPAHRAKRGGLGKDATTIAGRAFDLWQERMRELNLK
jgi:hypothetical protein